MDKSRQAVGFLYVFSLITRSLLCARGALVCSFLPAIWAVLRKRFVPMVKRVSKNNYACSASEQRFQHFIVSQHPLRRLVCVRGLTETVHTLSVDEAVDGALVMRKSCSSAILCRLVFCDSRPPQAVHILFLFQFCSDMARTYLSGTFTSPYPCEHCLDILISHHDFTRHPHTPAQLPCLAYCAPLPWSCHVYRISFDPFARSLCTCRYGGFSAEILLFLLLRLLPRHLKSRYSAAMTYL
jgi:hypothetical protein